MSYLVHFESWTTMFTSKIDGAGCDDLSEKATGFWNDRKTVIITSKVCRKISTYRLRNLKRCCGCIARSDGIFMFIIDSIVVGQTGQTWCKCVVFMRRMRPFKTALKICWFSEEEKKLFTGGMKTDCETLDIYIITNIFTILVLFSSSFFNFANFKSILIHFSGKFSRKSQNPTSIFFLQIFIFDRWI